MRCQAGGNEAAIPKLLAAQPPKNQKERHQTEKRTGSRHDTGDWIRRAMIIVRNWEEYRTGAIARELHRHPQTVRERLARFNSETSTDWATSRALVASCA